jgi:Mlc titration factor MtfA (ptsG expression regulator)
MADSPFVNQVIRDTVGLPDSLQVSSDNIVRDVPQDLDPNTIWHPQGNQSWIPILFFVLFITSYFLWRYLRQRKQLIKLNLLYEEKKTEFDDILCRYNPYYKSLGNQNKERFLRRTIAFMNAKDFKYIGLEAEEMIPLLISATAIQLTFGLDQYLLDYFHTIYVLKDSYRYGLSEKPFEGHVSEEGIFLSWSHFLREFDNYTDGENVGLHEMAHALTYVNFTVQEGKDDSFRSKFYQFSPIARPVFERMKAGETTLLDNYAASSFEEFWAVSIETFFERPLPFREQLPEVYFGLCYLLNQDPLSPDKIEVIGSQLSVSTKIF